MNYQNNPYLLQALEEQKIQGIPPIMQNIAAQQQNQNAAMAQGQQIAQQGAQAQGSGQGANMALAMALRKDKKGGKTVESDALKKEIEGLGSNTWNPLSDYNTGANGWGNYGE